MTPLFSLCGQQSTVTLKAVQVQAWTAFTRYRKIELTFSVHYFWICLCAV